MIRIVAIKIQSEHTRRSFEAELSAQWLAAWRERHPKLCGLSPSPKTERVAIESLAGLCLAVRAGARGELFYDEKGRPCLKDRHMDLSITHTDGYALCALGEGWIGLDAERIDRANALMAERLMQRWFCDSERQAYAQAPSELRFLELWTRKEAAVKASGIGLAALAETDTLLMGKEGNTAFSTWQTEGLVVTLCHSQNDRVLDEIEWI